jgi:hypothetical protein
MVLPWICFLYNIATILAVTATFYHQLEIDIRKSILFYICSASFILLGPIFHQVVGGIVVVIVNRNVCNTLLILSGY